MLLSIICLCFIDSFVGKFCLILRLFRLTRCDLEMRLLFCFLVSVYWVEMLMVLCNIHSYNWTAHMAHIITMYIYVSICLMYITYIYIYHTLLYLKTIYSMFYFIRDNFDKNILLINLLLGIGFIMWETIMGCFVNLWNFFWSNIDDSVLCGLLV